MTSWVTTAAPAVTTTRRPSLRRLPQLALERLLLWLTLARTRRDLAALDDRALHDIGIDRATAAAEADKPFWRAY